MSSTAIMLYYEYREHFECLSDEECGALVKALLAYGEDFYPFTFFPFYLF